MNIEDLTANDLLYDRSYMLGLPSVLSCVWLAMCLAERGEFREAVDIAEQALSIAETGDPAYSLIVACAGLGSVHVLKGDFEGAAAVLERGLRTNPGEPVGRVWPFVASTLGAAWTGMGRFDKALPLLEQAVERAAAIKLMANQPLRLVRLAEGHVRAGRPESAFPVAVQALEMAEEQRERGHEAYAHWLLGESWAKRDAPDLDRAEQHYRKGLAAAGQLGMRPLEGHCHWGLGCLAGRRGDAEGARGALDAARDLFREMELNFWLRQLEAVAREV
jgi:tetratricopeptide (TPR) repeat protein